MTSCVWCSEGHDDPRGGGDGWVRAPEAAASLGVTVADLVARARVGRVRRCFNRKHRDEHFVYELPKRPLALAN